MNNCGNCANYDRAKKEHTDVCGKCITAYVNNERQEPSHWKPLPQTNADRIRAMTDEELAKHLVDIGFDCHLCSEHRRLDNEPLLRGQRCDENCVEHCLEWLQQPCEGD